METEMRQPKLCRANGQDICLLCKGSHEISDLHACLFTLAKAVDAARAELARLREDLQVAKAEGIRWFDTAEFEQGRVGAAFSELATLRAELASAQAGSARLAAEITRLEAAVQQERATATGERDSRIAAEEARAWAEGEAERRGAFIQRLEYSLGMIAPYGTAARAALHGLWRACQDGETAEPYAAVLRAALAEAERLTATGQALHTATIHLLIEQYHEESTAETQQAYMQAVQELAAAQAMWRAAVAGRAETTTKEQ